MDKVVCPNCGADISVKEPKCPFCGYINVTGAEEKFMRDVQKTEEDLSQIPEMQKKQLKKTLSKSSKIIIVTIVIATVIALCIVGFFSLMDWVFSLDSGRDPKVEMQWERENFPVIDEMYAQARYDEIIEFEYAVLEENREKKTKHDLSNWDHYYFLRAYENYTIFKSKIEEMENRGTVYENDAEDLVYYGMWYYYRNYDKSYYVYTEEELALIENYREEILVDLFGRLKFTEEELADLQEDVIENDILMYRPCWDYAIEIMDRFE